MVSCVAGQKQSQGTMRIVNTTKILAKHVLKYYKISQCLVSYCCYYLQVAILKQLPTQNSLLQATLCLPLTGVVNHGSDITYIQPDYPMTFWRAPPRCQERHTHAQQLSNASPVCMPAQRGCSCQAVQRWVLTSRGLTRTYLTMTDAFMACSLNLVNWI